MLNLPLQNSPLRELFGVADLIPFGTPAGRAGCPAFRDAKAIASHTLSDPVVRLVAILCIRSNGRVHLIQFSRAGAKTLWDFGAP